MHCSSLLLSILLCFSSIVHQFYSLRVMQRIAIVGGGYAGLGTGAKLSKIAKSIHVYDHFPPGLADASATSAGILHPMATRGKIIWKGNEGMQQALDLMQSVQTATSGPIYDQNIQLNRLLYTDAELNLWRDAVDKNPTELEWLDAGNIQSGSTTALAGVRMKRAVVVDSPAYLRALWAEILKNCPHAEWMQRKVSSVLDLSQQYDAVILACGGGVVSLCKQVNLPTGNKIDKLRLIRGQNAVYESSSESFGSYGHRNGYLSGEYCLPYVHKSGSAAKEHMLAGSTHEHITSMQYETLTTGDKSPDLSVLQAQIQTRLERICPALSHCTPVHVVAGTKVVTNRDALGRLPIVGKLHMQSDDRANSVDNVWVHTGFGSRGLVLHALTSGYLSQALLHNDEARIPECLHLMAK